MEVGIIMRKLEEDLVSIVIPTYKTNNSLIRAIDSVLNQTYTNIEVIVVDDNNPDSNYRKKAEEIIKQYNNVVYVQHKQNKNGSAARNTGVSHSHGKYVGFLDDDDYFLPTKIEKEILLMKKNHVDFCTCFYYRNNYLKKFLIKDDYTYEIFFCKTTPQTSSFLLTRMLYNRLNGFDEKYYRHQDYEFLLRACKIGKIGVVPEPLYVLDDNGVVNVPNGERLENIKNIFLQDFDYLIEEKNLNRKKVHARNYSLVFFAYLKSKDVKNAFRILKKYFNVYFIWYFLNRIFSSLRYKIKGK